MEKVAGQFGKGCLELLVGLILVVGLTSVGIGLLLWLVFSCRYG